MTTTKDYLDSPASLERQEAMLAALTSATPRLDGHPLFAPAPRVSDTVLAAATAQATEEIILGRPLKARMTLSHATEVATMLDEREARDQGLV